MRSIRPAIVALVISTFVIAAPSQARRCPVDSVQVGDVCVDKYEASVWSTTTTGSRTGCLSDAGAFDMVGNVFEWVADWVPRSTFTSPGWGSFSDDFMGLSGASTTSNGPGALYRGGAWGSGTSAGPFFVDGALEPWQYAGTIGFHCARRP